MDLGGAAVTAVTGLWDSRTTVCLRSDLGLEMDFDDGLASLRESGFSDFGWADILADVIADVVLVEDADGTETADAGPDGADGE